MIPSEIINTRKAKDVYEAIRRRGVISKMDLKQISGLTLSTLTRLLDELTAQELILEVGYGESRGGRRPILYRTNPNYAYVFGLDISRTNSRLVLCDLHLNKLDTHIWRMDEAMTPKRLIQELTAVVPSMLKRNRIDRQHILGMGIGAVGPLDLREGKILDPQNFPSPEWRDIPICDIAKGTLSMDVTLDNGANAALLGEYWTNSDEDFEHLLYVHTGVGLRSAMITGGNIVYGAVDMEGAAGQMIIQCDGPAPRHASGNYGSWETYVSTYAVENAVKSALKMGRSSVVMQYVERIEDVQYPIIEQALNAKDPLVMEIMNQTACYFGIGLANLLNILHPQKVILGGPLISGNDTFYQQSIEVALSKTYHAPKYHVLFEKSKLGEDAVAVGAAALVIRKMTE